MIIFLFGEDTYRLKQKLAEIIGHYKEVHKSGLNLKSFDFSKGSSEDISLQDLKDGMAQVSMFKEKKMIVLANPFLDAGFKEEFLKEAKDFIKSQDIIVVCQEGAVDKRNALFKFLKENVKCQEFESLSGVKLRVWVKKEFERNKTEINSQALDMLVEYAGGDLWRLSNEINKIISFKKRKEIKPEDVALLVRSNVETDIFKTIDAIAQKDKKQALKLLQKHLEKGDAPLYLLSMINYQFRNLLIIKDLIEKRNTFQGIAKKSGLHPFVVKKSYFLAQKFTFPELKKIYQKIFQVDFDIKTGKIDPEAALEILVVGI